MSSAKNYRGGEVVNDDAHVVRPLDRHALTQMIHKLFTNDSRDGLEWAVVV